MSELPRWFHDVDWHPAVLAGVHAWRMHGITGLEPPGDHMPLVVPADAWDQVDVVLNDVWSQLRRRWWDDDTNVVRTELGVEVLRPSGRVVVTIDALAKELGPNAFTVASGLEGVPVPVIGRTVALVHRAAAIPPRATVQDVVDVAQWAEPLSRKGGPGGVETLAELGWMSSHPEAVAGLGHAVTAARGPLADHPRVAPVRGALERLDRALDTGRQMGPQR